MIVRRVAVTLLAVLTATTAMADDMTWAQLKAACEAGGTVTLTNDVTRDAAGGILIENTTVTVDLNGHTIRGYADEAKDDYSAEHYSGNSIFYVNTDGSLTITDGSSEKSGTIANVWGANAVYINENGSVTMTGGTIRNATTGVDIYDNGRFTMTGGTIRDNNWGVEIESADATFTVSGNVNITGNGKGVSIYSADATFTVSGNVNITGNTQDVGLWYEYDSFKPIHIGSDGLAATARIGVKRGAGWGKDDIKPFTSGPRDKGTKNNFVCNDVVDSDDPYFMVTALSGEMAFVRPMGKGDVPDAITGGIYFYQEYGQRKAIIDASSTSTLCIPQDNYEWFDEDGDEDGVEVWGVTYHRTFTPGKASTVMLPFSYETGDNGEGVYAEGGAFYSFGGVKKENGEWVAEMFEEWELKANTPYLFVPDEGSTSMLFPGINNGNKVSLNTTGGGSMQNTDADGWVFQGTYEARHWYDGTDGIHNAENADEIGTVYGFAATSGKATDGETDVEVGQFVQVAPGASIKPTRAYLKYVPSANARGAAAAQELPKTISVRLVKKGETMGIPTPDPSRAGGEDGYYTLSGPRLTHGQKPTAKGLYIINGRKEVVK